MGCSKGDRSQVLKYKKRFCYRVANSKTFKNRISWSSISYNFKGQCKEQDIQGLYIKGDWDYLDIHCTTVSKVIKEVEGRK
jgi:hypothetical protein